MRYCLALDLIDDPDKIAAYDAHHKSIWPVIKERIRESGIIEMEIYRVANRLFMIMETRDDFDIVSKAEADRNNPDVQRWEQLMWSYQQPLPFAKPGEKWVMMDKIFTLD